MGRKRTKGWKFRCRLLTSENLIWGSSLIKRMEKKGRRGGWRLLRTSLVKEEILAKRKRKVEFNFAKRCAKNGEERKDLVNFFKGLSLPPLLSHNPLSLETSLFARGKKKPLTLTAAAAKLVSSKSF